MKSLIVTLGSIVVAMGLGACATHHENVVLAEPETELDEDFNNVTHAGRMYFAGQPTPDGLAAMKERGVTTVISIRTPEEHAERVPFDEQAEVENLGLRYVNLPMTPELFTPELIDNFAKELQKTDGNVLVHCGSSNRVGTLWATYLVKYENFDIEEAIEHGKAAGISRESSEQAVRDYLDKYGK